MRVTLASPADVVNGPLLRVGTGVVAVVGQVYAFGNGIQVVDQTNDNQVYNTLVDTFPRWWKIGEQTDRFKLRFQGPAVISAGIASITLPEQADPVSQRIYNMAWSVPGATSVLDVDSGVQGLAQGRVLAASFKTGFPVTSERAKFDDASVDDFNPLVPASTFANEGDTLGLRFQLTTPPAAANDAVIVIPAFPYVKFTLGSSTYALIGPEMSPHAPSAVRVVDLLLASRLVDNGFFWSNVFVECGFFIPGGSSPLTGSDVGGFPAYYARSVTAIPTGAVTALNRGGGVIGVVPGQAVAGNQPFINPLVSNAGSASAAAGGISEL
jgi:hypothetical protein